MIISSLILLTMINVTDKTLFIIPTDAHNYKIIGMLKTIKIPTIAPTCFGSRRNHHQGATSCLAKTTIRILLCSSLMTWSMSWRHAAITFLKVLTLVWVAGTNAIKDNNRVISQESYQSYNKSLDVIKCK